MQADDQRRNMGCHFGIERAFLRLDRGEARCGRPAREDRSVVEAGYFELRIAVGDDGDAGAALRDQRVELRAASPPTAPGITPREQAGERLARIRTEERR